MFPSRRVCFLTCSYSIANATADLLVLATWSCVLDTVQGEPIPVREGHIWFHIMN